MDNIFDLFELEKQIHHAERMWWKWDERLKYLVIEQKRLSKESKGGKP